MDGERESQPLIITEFNERNGELSPDDRWMAYKSDASGQYEVYVQPFPNVDDGRWQVSTGGGTKPLWGPDERELFYVTEGGVMAVTVETGAGFAPGTPALIVEGPYYEPQANILGRTCTTDDPFAGLTQIPRRAQLLRKKAIQHKM